MDANVQIDQASKKRMIQALEEFAKATGRTVEDGIMDIARGGARRLAHTIQPYGLTKAKGTRFESSIGGQVYRAVMNSNVTGVSGNAADAHRAKRDSQGRVPKGLQMRGQFQRAPVPIEERERHAKNQKAKAGRAKGAWIEAGDSIGSEKISGVAQWISRHRTGGYGRSSKSGSGLSFSVAIENKTPYLSRIQPDRTVAQSVAYALKNGFSRLQKATTKAIEKANASTQ
jgi:hypothetical protein